MEKANQGSHGVASGVGIMLPRINEALGLTIDPEWETQRIGTNAIVNNKVVIFLE